MPKKTNKYLKGGTNQISTIDDIFSIQNFNTLSQADIETLLYTIVSFSNELFINETELESDPNISTEAKKEIDKIENNTNNESCGVIINEGGELAKACYVNQHLAGGGLAYDINAKRGHLLLEDLRNFCRIYNKSQQSIEIQDLLRNKTSSNLYSRFTELSKYILANSREFSATLFINCNPFYAYDTLEQQYDESKILTKQIECFAFNSDIVMAYEQDLIDGIEGIDDKSKKPEFVTPGRYQNYPTLNRREINSLTRSVYSNNPAIDEFIREQHNYISQLTTGAKRTIQDYTKINTSFYFYILHKTNQTKKFDLFREFGDSFYTQIFKLYGDTYDDELTAVYDENPIIEYRTPRGSTNWYQHWCENSRRVNDIKEDHGHQSEILGNHNTRSIFADLDFIDWHSVVDQFIDDISNIILSGPEVKKTIYGYRGVSGHYVRASDAEKKDTEKIDIIRAFVEANKSDDKSQTRSKLSEDLLSKKRSFINTRLSSVTFDFNIAKNFYKSQSSKDAAIYKTSILPGCHVLLASPLSFFYQEFEIIIPPYATTTYYDLEKIRKFTNNIANKYAICDDEEFQSFTHSIVSTPKSFDELKKRPQQYVNKKIKGIEVGTPEYEKLVIDPFKNLISRLKKESIDTGKPLPELFKNAINSVKVPDGTVLSRVIAQRLARQGGNKKGRNFKKY